MEKWVPKRGRGRSRKWKGCIKERKQDKMQMSEELLFCPFVSSFSIFLFSHPLSNSLSEIENPWRTSCTLSKPIRKTSLQVLKVTSWLNVLNYSTGISLQWRRVHQNLILQQSFHISHWRKCQGSAGNVTLKHHGNVIQMIPDDLREPITSAGVGSSENTFSIYVIPITRQSSPSDCD